MKENPDPMFEWDRYPAFDPDGRDGAEYDPPKPRVEIKERTPGPVPPQDLRQTIRELVHKRIDYVTIRVGDPKAQLMTKKYVDVVRELYDEELKLMRQKPGRLPKYADHILETSDPSKFFEIVLTDSMKSVMRSGAPLV